MSALHGFRRWQESIFITHIPQRKKPVLLIGHGNKLRKIATFDSEKDAEMLCDMLDEWFAIQNESEVSR